MTSILTWFDRAVIAIAVAVTVLLLAVVMAGVVSRALEIPLAFTDELSGFLMVWLACFGWIIACRRQAHIRIRFFQDRMPAAMHRVAEILIQITIAVLGLVVAYKSITLIHANSDVEAVTLPISVATMYVPILIAGIAAALQAGADLVLAIMVGKKAQS